MNTENTDKDGRTGLVFYDGACGFCVRAARRVEGSLARVGYALVPLQSAEAHTLLQLPESELMREMKVLTPEGTVVGGADAVVHLAARVGGRWIEWVAAIPGVLAVLRATYRRIAANRYCLGGTCRVTQPARGGCWADGVPVAVFTLMALVFGRHLDPWGQMWVLCFALFFGFKWIALRRALRSGARAPLWRRICFLFAWVGMDAEAFLRRSAVTRSTAREWMSPAASVAAGVILAWGCAPLVGPGAPMLAGWIGMTGLILILHFGAFGLLAHAWRFFGVEAVPLMLEPLRAKTLAEFWGRRWNTGFHRLAHSFAFIPLRHRLGTRPATMTTFLASGVIHDLVISLPAGAGYGLPTAYFALQGIGVLFEREMFRGRRDGALTRLFTICVIVGPAFWLFHPPFVRNVMLPFLEALNEL